MQTDWEAHYLDGRTATRQRATIRLLRSGVQIATESGQTAWWPYALAAPGGYVVVFRGLLERTQSAEELAGVLAHERGICGATRPLRRSG